jgi:hypothetical protein
MKDRKRVGTQISRRRTHPQGRKVVWEISSIHEMKIPGDGIVINGCIEVDVHEGLRSKSTRLGIVTGLEGLKINIVGATGSVFNGNIGGKVETGV